MQNLINLEWSYFLYAFRKSDGYPETSEFRGFGGSKYIHSIIMNIYMIFFYGIMIVVYKYVWANCFLKGRG